MEAILSQQRILPAIAAFVVGIAVCLLVHTPLGLLAPIVALFLFASSRAEFLLHAASATGLVGALLIAAFYEGEQRDLAVVWAAFFALRISIGALLAARTPPSPNAEAMPAVIRTTTREEAWPYPASGPTLKEKVAPRTSPLVSTAATDDKDAAALFAAASFWGGTPFHVRYWRRLIDGSHRWREIRTEPLDEPGGTQRWSGVSSDVDNPNPAPPQPTKMASNPPIDGDAVRAAKVVERLLGNAWAFDAAGRPTYLTPIAQTFVAVTLEEFQAAVDEGHTFFKRTAHPDDYDRISTAWRHSLKTGDPFFLDRRIRRASGIHEWNRTGFVPTHDRQGRITGWYGATVDFDAHRIAETNLREREQELSRLVGALRRSEQQLQQLVDAVPAMIWSTTPEGRPSYVNKRFTDVIGATLKDITAPDGSPSLDAIIHPDDLDATVAKVRHSFATGVPYVMQYRQVRRDGSYRWTETRAEALRDESGAVLQWYGVSVDIHDLVTAQEALHERERELSQLVNMVPVLIRRLTPAGEPTFFNKRLIDFFGLKDLSDLDKPDTSRLAAAIQSLVHADDATNLLATARRSFAAGEPFSMKYRMRRADGAYRWVDTRAEPLRNQSGAIVQWYVVSLDVDDEVRAQQALRRSLLQLRQLIDAVPTQIWSLKPNGEPAYMNKTMLDYMGTKVEDYDRKKGLPNALRTIHPEDQPSVMAGIQHSLNTGEPFELRWRNRRSDGAYRWTNGCATPLRDENGSIIHWYGVNVDIHDMVTSQEELRSAQERLARASQAASLAELSASIAHEVNQPLAAIVANSHACQRWLSAEPANVERAKITVERIIRDANAAAEVVSRIRALFRQSVAPRDIALLSGAIDEARSLMAEEAARRRIRMDIDIESNLPLAAFDRVQIQQVLINLIRNGFDAMDSTSGDRVLEMRVRQMGDAIHTEISDRGAGIEFPDKIFEAFFTTKQNGMGMGLAICRSIVESHGGRLWAEKNEPRGATFIFTLPIEMKSA